MKKSKKEKEKEMFIEFTFSKSGIPVIELGDYGKLTFSKITSHPEKGYKYLCFSHFYNDVISAKVGNGERKTFIVPTNKANTVDMYLQRRKKTSSSDAIGLPRKTIPTRLKDYLKKIIEPFIDEEGYFHYMYIDDLKEKINGKDINEILKKVQKKRKKRKKKKKDEQ